MSHASELLGAASDLASLVLAAHTVARITRSWITPNQAPAPASVPSTHLSPERGPQMIEIIARSGEPEAMNCPALICDACRKQVTDSGNIIWGTTIGVEPRLSTPLFVAHKGRCDQAVQQGLTTDYPGDEWVWLWEEAGKLLVDLAGNFKRRFEGDANGTFHEHRIALSLHPTQP